MIKNERLIDVHPFVENGIWYLKFTFEYEDDMGLHQRIYPKVGLPISSFSLPFDTLFYDQDGFDHHIESCDQMPIYKSSCADPRDDSKLYKDVCVIDAIIKPAIHEMTIEEIEEKLGYKIKVVSKEESE